jgi:hypothetical protein
MIHLFSPLIIIIIIIIVIIIIIIIVIIISDYPVSTAFNPSGTMACVLNGGIRNGFRCYTVSGDLSLGLTITSNPPTGNN